jgi:primosomal protein N'
VTRRAVRAVEVAVDAVGPGGNRLYTYHVPARLGAVSAGEAVLVEFGRRQAVGVVLGDVEAPSGVETKPILELVRSDGPLLPPLQVSLARAIAEHYLAPPAAVVRAMLPPGLLERLELVAKPAEPDDSADSAEPARSRASGEGQAAASPAVEAPVGGESDALETLLASAPLSGVPVTVLPAAQGRAALLRRLRAL